MVESRTRPQKRKKKRPDLLAAPVFAAFLVVILWIGYDLYQGIMYRQKFIQRITGAIKQNDRGAPYQALETLLTLQNEWSDRESTPAEAILQRFMPLSMKLEQQFGVVHSNIGGRYSQAQMPAMAIRHYSLALSYRRDLGSVARELAQDCFFAKNYELGWVAAKRAQSTADGQAVAASLLRSFERHYRGQRYATVPD